MEPYEGREPYIFISYARKDGARVTPYLEALAGAGWRVWYDAGIQAGADSRYCYLETEWAHRKQKNIVPLHLEEMKPDGIPRLYQLLQGLQDIRLYKYADAAQFAERIRREPAFTLCKAPEWHKIGEIQWRFTESDGVLSIAQNEDIPEWYGAGSIPPYQYDPIHRGSTAPWMSHREGILSVKIADDIDAIGGKRPTYRHAEYPGYSQLQPPRLPFLKGGRYELTRHGIRRTEAHRLFRNAQRGKVQSGERRHGATVVGRVGRGRNDDRLRQEGDGTASGPVVVIDTPGLDDEGELGELRMKKARETLARVDIAVLVVDALRGFRPQDERREALFQERKLSYLIAYNKADLLPDRLSLSENALYVSAISGENVTELKERLGACRRTRPVKSR